MKLTYKDVCTQLDQLFLMPLHYNETIEQRDLSVQAYLESVGWTWDDIIEELLKPISN